VVALLPGGRDVQTGRPQIRRNEHLRDRREVADGIIRQPVIEAWVYDKRRITAHQQRVTIGRRLGDAIGRNVAAGAGDVLHHHRPAPCLAEFVRQQPRRDVRGDARREADHDLDALLRIRLRERRPGGQQCSAHGEDAEKRCHGGMSITRLMRLSNRRAPVLVVGMR
jgi:hypothetical protein